MNFLDQFTGGLKEDIVAFQQEFLALKTLRFPEFATLWKKWKFTEIFQGKNKLELEIFVDNCFQLLLSMFSNQLNNVQQQVSQVYFLYAVYYMQPIQPKLQIRLQPNHFTRMEELVKYSQQNGHFDIIYVIGRLHFDHAFHYVAFAKRHCLNKTMCDTQPNMALGDGNNEPSIFAGLKDLKESSILQQIRTLHTEYVAGKSTLSALGSTNLVGECPVDKIEESIEYIEKQYAALAPFERTNMKKLITFGREDDARNRKDNRKRKCDSTIRTTK